ncbi:hypothetical protein [Candidatus Poriferisocius sp.]|uniref:hypothetical protein n=1 Tax=Candidatus Poriferisocius sp. TaxID=3101276 RepID=UPI003B01108C
MTFRRAWFLLGAVFAASGLAGCSQSPLVQDAEPAPMVVAVDRQEVTITTFATLELEWSRPEVLWVAASGLVTEVLVQPGYTVPSGSALLNVDGAPLVGLHTPAPFHRALEAGDSGDDVAMLTDALAAAGDLPAETADNTTFTPVVAEAVQQFNQRHNLGNTDSFDPSRIVWLPKRSVVAGQVNLRAGEEVAGRTIGFTLSPELLDARLVGLSRPISDWANTSVILPNGLELPLPEDGLVPANSLTILQEAVDAGVPDLNVRVEKRLGTASLVPVTAVQQSARGDACVYDKHSNVHGAVIVGGEAGIVYISGTSLDEVLANPTALDLANCGGMEVDG